MTSQNKIYLYEDYHCEFLYMDDWEVPGSMYFVSDAELEALARYKKARGQEQKLLEMIFKYRKIIDDDE